VSRKGSEIEQTAGGINVPELVRAAGKPAVRAFREFLEDERLSANTRRVYCGHVRRFCRWAEAQGLPIVLIAPSDIAAYLKPLSSHAATDALSVLRRLFAPIVTAGLLSANPCAPHGRPRAYELADNIPVSWLQDRLAWELRALRRDLMAELDKRYGDDQVFQVIKCIDRQLAAMNPPVAKNTGGAA
jgi:hypothetical protein